MPHLAALVRLSELLLVAAGILRTFSNSDLSKGVISKETQLAARIEGISIEIAALVDMSH